jgi:hypothetical protein
MAIVAAALVLLPAGTASASSKPAPMPTQQQINACVKSVTSNKPMTAKQVRGCLAAVWQSYTPHPCPKDITNPLDTQYVKPSGYLIDLGHGYRNIHGKAAHEWAVRAGHKPFMVANQKVTQEQIDAAICSTPVTTTMPTRATSTESSAAQQYLADVAPFNAAVNTYTASFNSSTQYSQLPALVTPLVTALQTFDSLVLRQQWPASVKQDIKTMVAADGVYQGDLQSLESANALNISTIDASVSRDANASTEDSNIVRSDLGLPPPQS